MNAKKIGLIVSLIASISGIWGWKLIFEEFGGGDANADTGMVLLGVAFVGALVSYIMCGGFKVAGSAAITVGKIGWIIIPFPLDIISGIISCFVAMTLFVTIPIVFNLIAYFSKKENIDETP